MAVYRTRGLPDGTEVDGEFDFIIDDYEMPSTLRIPGEQRGPDLCIPDHPAQERWLNSRRDLVIPVWHCVWRFVSAEAERHLVQLLSSRGNGPS